MRRRYSPSWILMISAMAGLLVVAMVAYSALDQSSKSIRVVEEPLVHWHAAQTEVELAKFIAVMSRFAAKDPGVDQGDVNARFDLLWSHTANFRDGRVADSLRALDEEIGAIPVLLHRIQSNETAVLSMDPDNASENARLMQEFGDVHDRLRHLVNTVRNVEEDRYFGVREQLKSGWELNSVVYSGAVVLAALIVGLLLVEARRTQRIVRETEELADKAQAADRAKSRFLTMMSHELRTPMNGVLGLIALAKQSGLTDAQARLLEQAERSGVHMTNLLSDILDFSDLQTERLEIDNAAFEPRALGEAVHDLIETSARRNALEVEINYAVDMPDWVIGDFARLRQALAHFASYFVEIVAIDDIRLAFTHHKGELICAIDMDAKGVDRPGWQPEAIFGREREGYGDFASDSLGPTIARGLVSLMGGTVEMTRPVPGRARLIVAIPAKAMAPQQDCIRVEMTSETSDMLARAAIDPSRWRIWEPKMDRASVAAVLIESARAEADPDMVGRLRKLHPGARIIGAGPPSNLSGFDAFCTLPLDERRLAAVLSPDETDAAIA